MPTIPSLENDDAQAFVDTYLTPLAQAFHAGVGNFRVLIGKPGFQSWVATPEAARDAWLAIAWCLVKIPGASAETLHNAWWDFKRCSGWTYGEEKDFDKKTHPMMKPLSDCPPDFQYRYVICMNLYSTLTDGWAAFSGQQ